MPPTQSVWAFRFAQGRPSVRPYDNLVCATPPTPIKVLWPNFQRW